MTVEDIVLDNLRYALRKRDVDVTYEGLIDEINSMSNVDFLSVVSGAVEQVVADAISELREVTQ